MRLLVVLALLLGSASPALAAPPLHVVVRGQDHHPRVGKPWSYEVRITNAAGKPVPAHLHMQFIFASLPVGEVGRHYVQSGIWRETFGRGANPPFPPASRGQRLVLRATATAKGTAPAKAGWWVVPR